MCLPFIILWRNLHTGNVKPGKIVHVRTDDIQRIGSAIIAFDLREPGNTPYVGFNLPDLLPNQQDI